MQLRNLFPDYKMKTIFLLLIISTYIMQAKKEIIYVFDPFCTWCYAMSDVVERIENEYSEDFTFVAKTGGMILGDSVGSINDNFSFLKTAYQKVEDHTGTQFGPSFKKDVLEVGDYVISSLEPSIAMTVFKSLDEKNAIKFLHKLQEAFYFDGKDIKDKVVLSELASQFGVDKSEFVKRFEDPKYLDMTNEEFAEVGKWGVSGYPAIFLRDGENLYRVSSGYQYFMDLKNIMIQIKGQTK